jgi:O-antigen ligase
VQSIFAALFGALLGLALLKFGNPPIMEKWVTVPTDIFEFALGYPWPMSWGWWLLGLVGLLGLFAAKPRTGVPRWLLALPLLWLGWQCVAAIPTTDSELTKATMKHFAACVACFYLGCFCLAPARRFSWFWVGLLGGLLLVLLVGWDQHFGGIEASRRYFYLYVYPSMKEVPPGYLKRISSTRIWGTLFYPNALAGVILLLLPASLALLYSLRRRFTVGARSLLVCIVGVAALACLFWSQSKGGWLLLLVQGGVAALFLPWSRKLKLLLITSALMLGLAGFFWRYSTFFQKGATSVSARFDYWHAALQTAKARPVFGSGPGTFALAYERIKQPESEMSRLTHNDYLEQASDSGVAGFLTYTSFIVGALVWTLKRARPMPDTSGPCLATDTQPGEPWLAFSVWLGLFGWALQSVFEFGLYIPALAWPAFAMLGWSVGKPARQSTQST